MENPKELDARDKGETCIKLREKDKEESLSPPRTGVCSSEGQSLKLSRSMPG